MTSDHREPFLRQVAQVYACDKNALAGTAFVLPNKRSATFFRHYLSAATCQKTPAEVTTISAFLSSFSELEQATRLQLLLTLYDAYRKISPRSAPDFDQFIFWGEMLIGDFNDVDTYLIDPESIFTNVNRFKEISANYLTPEQIAVIRRYWGEEPPVADIDRFWNHIARPGDEKDSKAKDKFLKLWQILMPLYTEYHKALAAAGLAAPGMQRRLAVDAVKKAIGDGKLKHSRYVFIGFNVLTPAERQIFTLLRDAGVADFYWDYNSPAFAAGFNKAGHFITRNIQDFPSRHQLPEEPIATLPDIEIIGVPSASAEVKLASTLLEELADSGEIADTANAVDTAVVLPDESQFIQLRRSIPYDKIPEVNVTMGLPMRYTPIAALMRQIVGMQSKGRVTKGEHTFFYEDITGLLANPTVRNLAPDQARALEDTISARRLFRVDAKTINETAPVMAPIFTPVPDSASPAEVCSYIGNVIDLIGHDAPEADAKFLDAYKSAAETITAAAAAHGVTMRRSTLLRMVERAVASEKIKLAGEPLKGLQVMGVLETRALDFKNIIMLSMNERIFPRKHYTGSFIPDSLRHAYGLATTDFQESIFAYYFYRLISRAKTVKLIYDARTVGLKSGEMSRYLTQLLYLYNQKGKVRHTFRTFTPVDIPKEIVEVPKTPRILEKLSLFKAGSATPRFLSASAINTYISCPLEFYLRYVEAYAENDEMKDFIDASSYGNILHETAQGLYNHLMETKKGSRTVRKEDLEPFVAPSDTFIQRTVTRITNRIHNRLDDNELDRPLVGEAYIMGKVIEESVKTMLKWDMKYTPFEFGEAEKEMKGVLPVNDALAINFKQKIDRIDTVGNVMRIVDYKTGDEAGSTPKMSDCFDGSMQKRPKGLMQTLLYALAYSTFEQSTEPIKPMIYNFRKIAKDGPLHLTVSKKRIDNHMDAMPDFLEHFNAKIEQMFDPGVPFGQAQNDSACKYCNFKAICGRDM